MYRLDSLSKHIRILTQEESDRLDVLDTTLPKSLSQCLTCGGSKQFRWVHDYGLPTAEIGDFKCPCADQYVLFKFLLNAGIGLLYQRYALGDITDVAPEAQAAAWDYVENGEYYIRQGKSFIFRGDRGTGKTLLATIMLKLLINQGVDGYFTTFNDLLDNYASGWSNDKQKAWFDQRVRNAPLLVVDDIGKEWVNRTAMGANAIDHIFRTRVQSAKPTIITTNLTTTELGNRYGNAMETLSGAALSYDFEGSSWREEKEKARARYEATNKLVRPIVIS